MPAAGDAFDLIVSIQTYPNRLFDLALVIGVFFIRRRRAKAGLPRPEYVAWDIALYFSIAANIFSQCARLCSALDSQTAH